MKWVEPSREEGKLWLSQFNDAFLELISSGFKDNDAVSKALFAIRTLLEYEPQCASFVSGTLVTLLFQGESLLPVERVLEAAELGILAERMQVDDDEGPLRRSYLYLAESKAALASHEVWRAIDAAGAAASQLQDKGGPAELKSFLASCCSLAQAEGWNAALEPGRAADLFRAASNGVQPLIDEVEPKALLLAQLTHFLHGEGSQPPEESVLVTMSLMWEKAALIAVRAAVGLADSLMATNSPAGPEAAREAADVIRELGPGSIDAFQLVGLVRQVGTETAKDLIAAVVEQAVALGLDADPYRAVLLATSAVSVAEGGGNPSGLLKEAEAARKRLTDDLAATVSQGWSALAETKRKGRSRAAGERQMREFVSGLEDLRIAMDPRLQDLRVRTVFDEPLAFALNSSAQDYTSREDANSRVQLALLVDGVWQGSRVLDALLREAGEPDSVEGWANAMDRLGRLEVAIRTWPDAVAIIQRELPAETLFLCVPGKGRPVVERAGSRWADSARNLGQLLAAQIAELEIVGTPGPDKTFEAAGRAAYDALPQQVREVIQGHQAILICPDFRVNGDSIPYELLHDGSGWLGLTKVIARYPSLASLTRSLEGTARRSQNLRALSIAVPQASGFEDLSFAKEEAQWVQERLAAEEWDAPQVLDQRISGAFVLDRMPHVAHMHIAAHGDATRHDESVILANGERLRTDDLLKRFFPRVPTVYLNTCSLGSTRYVGAGISRGIGLALSEAGAAAVVANVLPVDDAASSQLARAFYESDATFGESLRLARLKVADSGASPLFWGTTVLIGDPKTTLTPSKAQPALAERLLNAHFLRPEQVDQVAIQESEVALHLGDLNPRLEAAAGLLREVGSWTGQPNAADRKKMGAALRLALELDHLPTAAMIAYLITETIDDEADHDLALRAVKESLTLVEPLEVEGRIWNQLTDRLRARVAQLNRGSRRLEVKVSGGESDEVRAETSDIGQAIMDINLALNARASRGGYGPEFREELTPRDVCWNAILSSGTVNPDDAPAVFAFASQVVQRLVKVGGLPEASPHGRTAMAGLLSWLWGRQPATGAEGDFAKGQTGTLGLLVTSLAEHWPPAPAPWFELVKAFPEQTRAFLATLDSLPYDNELYVKMEEVISDIGAAALGLLDGIQAAFPDRLPDAAAWVLGTLTEVNTYSWTDGSVPEDISERLQGVYTDVYVKGDGLFMPWLKEGFRQVREQGADELQRWRYGLGEPGLEEADMAEEPDTEEDASETEGDETTTPACAIGRRLSRADRQARIRELLEEEPSETVDGLPEELNDLVVDESDIAILEECLTPSASLTAMSNAIQAISLLADWSWDHREIKSPETSIPLLESLYKAVTVTRIRRRIMETLFNFEPFEINFDFILERLATDAVEVKASILANLQLLTGRPYLEDVIAERLLPMLHDFCSFPLRQSIYRDEFSGEADFRFWVFRCLRVIGSPDSIPVIEAYLNTSKWPLETRVEAAHAHLAITKTLTYIEVLREAKRGEMIGNAESALEEMEKLATAQPRRRKKTPGEGPSASS